MPIYDYRCARGHNFEVMQAMNSEPIATCEHCAAPAERVLHAPAIHFKGSGFHNTDYPSRSRPAPMKTDPPASSAPSETVGVDQA